MFHFMNQSVVGCCGWLCWNRGFGYKSWVPPSWVLPSKLQVFVYYQIFDAVFPILILSITISPLCMAAKEIIRKKDL